MEKQHLSNRALLVPERVGNHFNVILQTPEIFFHEDVQSAAGGLGVVNGTLIDEVEWNNDRHGIRMLATSVYSSHGYQKQVIRYNADGSPYMDVEYVKDSHLNLTVDTGIRLTLTLAGRPCRVAVRTPAQDEGEKRFYTGIALFDTDIPENDEHPDFQMITRVLYGEGHATEKLAGERWMNIDWIRILRATVLGIGTHLLIKELGITFDVMHINESHSVFYQVHKLGLALERGLSFEEACKEARADTLYTNHTILFSGNNRFHTSEIHAVAGAYPGFDTTTLQRISRTADGSFPMTDSAFFLSEAANAVSVDHAEVAKKLWPGYNIVPVTNGVGNEYQHPEFANLDRADQIPALKEHFKHEVYKNLLARLADAGWTHDFEAPNPEAVLAVWARRNQGYKRPDLVFARHGFEFIRHLLDTNKLAIAWGGYVHPDDTHMMNRWNATWQQFQEVPNTIPVFNYRLDLMRSLLKAGAQIWLNTPQFRHEACGTSWMSAMLECALVLSVPDGGIREATHYVSFGDDTFVPFENESSRAIVREQFDNDALELKQLIIEHTYKWLHGDPNLLQMLF